MPYLRNASPEVFFLFSAAVGVVFAAISSRIPAVGFSFWKLLFILLSVDVIRYVAMKAGWLTDRGQPRSR
jgi:hypothetical protein